MSDKTASLYEQVLLWITDHWAADLHDVLTKLRQPRHETFMAFVVSTGNRSVWLKEFNEVADRIQQGMERRSALREENDDVPFQQRTGAS